MHASDMIFKIHESNSSRSSLPFKYTYNAKPDQNAPGKAGKIELKRYMPLVLADSVKLALEPNHMHNVYLQSPLTTWSIRLVDIPSKEKR